MKTTIARVHLPLIAWVHLPLIDLVEDVAESE